MSDTSYQTYQHYGTAAERAAFTPSPPAGATNPQPIYVWYETDTGDTYLYDTSWHLLASAGGGGITALTGDVTAGPGSGSQAATIAASAVTNAKMANMADQTIKGNDSGGAAAPQDLTANEVSTVLDGATDPFVRTSAVGAGGITELTGDVTAGPGSGSQAATIPADTVTYAKMQNMATGKVLGRGNTGSGDIEELTLSNGIETTTTPGLRLNSTIRTRSVAFVVDGGGSAITTGIKGDFRFPIAGTIIKNTVQGDQSGSIVLDVYKGTFATNSSPSVSICAAAKPTVTATVNSEDSTLTGWTTSISAGDCLRVNVDSISTMTRVTLTLDIRVDG